MAATTSRMSLSVYTPRWPMRKIFPLRWSCPLAMRMPWVFRTSLMMVSEGSPSGASTVVSASEGIFG